LEGTEPQNEAWLLEQAHFKICFPILLPQKWNICQVLIVYATDLVMEMFMGRLHYRSGIIFRHIRFVRYGLSSSTTKSL